MPFLFRNSQACRSSSRSSALRARRFAAIAMLDAILRNRIPTGWAVDGSRKTLEDLATAYLRRYASRTGRPANPLKAGTFVMTISPCFAALDCAVPVPMR